jgi:uncharacterized RDD family membrane protein YckC
MMEPIDATLHIDTPENVVFGYEIAGIGSRFIAALVDTLATFTLQGVVFLVLAGLARIFLTDIPDLDNRMRTWALAAAGLLAFTIYWGYYIFFEMAWNGQSLGKRWVGLRVILVDGTPISLSESIVRNLMRLVDMLPALYGVGIITMFINSQSRRLGDLAAGTLVVHDHGLITLKSLEASNAAISAEPRFEPATNFPIERLQVADINLAQEFLKRRAGLANRKALSMSIARMLCERMDLLDQDIEWPESEKLIVRVMHSITEEQFH